MEALSTLKEISEIVKKYNDLDLMKKIVSLQMEVFELSQQNLDLRRDFGIAKEKEQQSRKLQLKRVGDCNFYFLETDEVPFCPKCYEGTQKLVHLTNSEPWSGGVRRKCLVCKEFYYEQPTNTRPVHIRSGGSWMS